MGKRKRSKRGATTTDAAPESLFGKEKRQRESKLPENTTTKSSILKDEVCVQKMKPSTSNTNPLLDLQSKFLRESVTPEERDNFFSEDTVSSERRAQLWTEQSDLGEELVNRYAWATPDERALRIIRHFAPIVEIGCGSNAYWCNQMRKMGIDVLGFDKSPNHGGKIQSKGPPQEPFRPTEDDENFAVQSGGPEVLSNYRDRTLFLCYPDEHVMNNNNDGDDEDDNASRPSPQSMAEACLEHYKGDCIIHIGELFPDATHSMEQAPWGRSSSPSFQERLAAEYHCILRATLPNWLHTADRITVWKRSPTTVISYEDDSDGASAPEEVFYRHIPKEERIPVDTAAPCVAHLLAGTPTTEDQPPKDPTDSNSPLRKTNKPKSSKKKKKPKSQNVVAEKPYTCPW